MRSYRALLVAGIFLVAVSCSSGMGKGDITSVAMPLRDQQSAVWKFEKVLECDCFGPCFDAVSDGAMERDPGCAVEKCAHAVSGLNALSVPAGLPKKVTAVLEEALAILKKHAAWSLESARYAAGLRDTPAGFPPRAGTCDAYARIDKVNSLYGLKGYMKGSYINCDVLNKPVMPEFPGLNDLK